MKSIVLALVLVTAACGRGDGDIDSLIGDRCTADRDCDDRCFRDSSDYPGGFCSSACDSDNDCTTDAFCMDRNDGVCLFVCPEFDCGRLGAGWSCRERDRIGGGKLTVCIGE